MSHFTRIMYIEKKDGINGPGRIGRVTFSKSGRSIYYQGRTFASLRGDGFLENYYDVESGVKYWISGCKKDGTDRLYPGIIEIDEDVQEEYWILIRNRPEEVGKTLFKSLGKYRR